MADISVRVTADTLTVEYQGLTAVIEGTSPDASLTHLPALLDHLHTLAGRKVSRQFGSPPLGVLGHIERAYLEDRAEDLAKGRAKGHAKGKP